MMSLLQNLVNRALTFAPRWALDVSEPLRYDELILKRLKLHDLNSWGQPDTVSYNMNKSTVINNILLRCKTLLNSLSEPIVHHVVCEQYHTCFGDIIYQALRVYLPNPLWNVNLYLILRLRFYLTLKNVSLYVHLNNWTICCYRSRLKRR